MDNNTPSFAERIAALKAAAETVMLEAQRMEAAARKFDKRRQQKEQHWLEVFHNPRSPREVQK